MIKYDPTSGRWVITPEGVPPPRNTRRQNMIEVLRRHDPEAVSDVLDWLADNGWSSLVAELRAELRQ